MGFHCFTLATTKAKVTIYIDPELQKAVRLKTRKGFRNWVEEVFRDKLDKRHKERKKS